MRIRPASSPTIHSPSWYPVCALLHPAPVDSTTLFVSRVRVPARALRKAASGVGSGIKDNVKDRTWLRRAVVLGLWLSSVAYLASVFLSLPGVPALNTNWGDNVEVVLNISERHDLVESLVKTTVFSRAQWGNADLLLRPKLEASCRTQVARRQAFLAGVPIVRSDASQSNVGITETNIGTYGHSPELIASVKTQRALVVTNMSCLYTMT